MNKEEIRQLVSKMMECPMFRGEYDAKNGSESFMDGIATVMESLARLVDDTFYQEVSDIFTHNMVKSQEKVSKNSWRRR